MALLCRFERERVEENDKSSPRLSAFSHLIFAPQGAEEYTFHSVSILNPYSSFFIYTDRRSLWPASLLFPGLLSPAYQI